MNLKRTQTVSKGQDMRLTDKEKMQSIVYHGQKSFDNLGDLHQRMRYVRMLAQKFHGQIPSELYQAIFDLERPC